VGNEIFFWIALLQDRDRVVGL